MLRTFLRDTMCWACLACIVGPAVAEPPPIEVPEGFRVEQYADDTLAHDIYSMTIDSSGQVVVSGPGYVRTLLDTDGDGVADEYRTFADGPKTGAQGMHFMGSHLLCTGDGGLQIFRDKDRDGAADGPAQVLLRTKTGGEHHAHSIQRGPDGWWYLVAGNHADVTQRIATLTTSPIRHPQAGVMMRLRPDLSAGEIIADGYRNAYDFAFNQVGDIFTFDSDGERDISLPWYQPCRVFHAAPGSHAGWVSQSWKRPAEFPDMPPVVAAFGRGCPTGVTCYRHVAFPSRYEGALFVLDWTFGRILTVGLSQKNGGWQGAPDTFARARGNFGFAVTDIEVGPDGSLFVSVGGRGTQGGVYRISYEVAAPDVSAAGETNTPPDDVEKLRQVLTAPQPLSAWSRSRWYPPAKALGADAFVTAAADEGRRPQERVRAIEVLTDVFQGLSNDAVERLIQARSPVVRARTAWAIGRRTLTGPGRQAIDQLLNDDSPLVQRVALETLQTVTNSKLMERYIPRLAVALKADDPHVRSAAAKLIARLSHSQRKSLTALLADDSKARLWLQLGVTMRARTLNLAAAKVAAETIQQSESDTVQKLTALRVLQLALGDMGPQSNLPGFFEGYTTAVNVDSYGVSLGPVKTLLSREFPSGDVGYDRELIRTLAVLKSSDAQLVDRLLSRITTETRPADDIHCLAAIARNSSSPTEEQSQQTAEALVRLELKFERRGLKRDSHWDDRMQELYKALCQRDSQIPRHAAHHPDFGLPGHVPLLSEVPPQHLQTAIDSFVRQIEGDEEYVWSTDVVFVLGRSATPAHRELVYEQADNLSVRDAVLMVMARQPRQDQRALLLEGLQSTQLKAVEACVTALSRLPKRNGPSEQYALLEAARRLHANDREYKLREDIMRLLQNNMQQSFHFAFGRSGYQPQTASLKRWHTFLQERFPDYQPPNQVGKSAQQVLSALDDVHWHDGDVERGRALFAKLSCTKCHGGRKALGPDLEGVSKRFSRNDLFTAIVDPNRDVPDRYQLTTVVTTRGRSYSGLVVYESVDGVILRDAEHKTYRIEADDIESKIRRRISLMPADLLKNVGNRDLADLGAYLLRL